MNNWTIFTDGSCRGNKNGGIGVVWLNDGKLIQEYSKGFKNTTNNKMELTAIKVALYSIKGEINSLKIISDSEYSIGVITKPQKKKKNIELINSIKSLLQEKQKLVKSKIEFIHVKGHSKESNENSMWNNKADNLATTASNQIL